MRHVIGLVLVGLGVFLLGTGAMVHFHVAPQLIAAPTDTYNKTVLRADNATYFDVGALQTRTGATITATNTVRGDVRASNDDVAVWDSFAAVQDLNNNVLVDMRQQRLAFDRRSGELTGCCGTHIQNQPLNRPSGIGLFWPVDVGKRGYQVFDSQTRRAWPVTFAGEETLDGVRTYRFVQRIPPTKITEPARTVPGGLLGLGAGSGDVAVDRYYQAEATYWIDPRTGAPVNQRQHTISTLQAQQGPGRLVVADLDLRMTDESRRALLDKSEDGARSAGMIKTVVPLVCLVAGLVLVVGGLVLAARPRGTRGISRRDAAEA
ncbi:DUF3068 domain-containing protein [Actinomadura craniellae]|uniref:DUF3068 domain-containing protein n=1 Tax=Actinomadura craniellae TaxID=2231787 RepID=UPI0013147B71|nr:DUF3068 domain-containing protein [Actinomadura craniellae]